MPLPRPWGVCHPCHLLVGRTVPEHPPTGLCNVTSQRQRRQPPGSAGWPPTQCLVQEQSLPVTVSLPWGNPITPRCEVSVSLLSSCSSCFWVSLAQEAGTWGNFPLCQSQGLCWGWGELSGLSQDCSLGVQKGPCLCGMESLTVRASRTC